jgi:3-oxoacyl-[acyl-carrier-protein] synthase III
MGVEIIGTGIDIGHVANENGTIEQLAGLEAGWIFEKTGIKRRFAVDENQSSKHLATNALNGALEQANVGLLELDQLVVATYAHDKVFPSLASRLLTPLSYSKTQALDVQSNCTGFLNGIAVVHDRLTVDAHASIGAVVASEVNSRFVDKTDPNVASFFSDGAGAAVLRTTNRDAGIIGRSFFGDTNNIETVELSRIPNEDGKTTENSSSGTIRQAGMGTWKQAVTNLPKAIHQALERADLGLKDVDYFIFHQANVKLLEYLFAKMKISPNRAIINVDQIGNMGAASIPIALHQARVDSKISNGDLVMFASVGAGFNFSALLWRL